MAKGVIVLFKECCWVGSAHYLCYANTRRRRSGGVAAESEYTLDGSEKVAAKDRRGNEIISQAAQRVLLASERASE